MKENEKVTPLLLVCVNIFFWCGTESSAFFVNNNIVTEAPSFDLLLFHVASGIGINSARRVGFASNSWPGFWGPCIGPTSSGLFLFCGSGICYKLNTEI